MDTAILKTPQKIPQWKKIFNELSGELKTGNFNGGEHFYSLNEICRKYDVSMITAKRAVSELEEADMIRKYPGKGTFVFKNHSSLKVNVFADTGSDSQIRDYVDFQIFGGITEAIREKRAEMSTITKPDLIDKITSPYNLFFHEAIERMTLDKSNDFGISVEVHSIEKQQDMSSVGIDYWKGVSLAMKHLFSLGHKRIGLFAGELTALWMISRLEGYLKALRSRRIKTDWKIIKETDGINSESDWLAMKQVMSLKEPPTAIFACNDIRALHILEYCRCNNIKVPEQLSIVGFDNRPEAGLSKPGLTTIDTHLWEVGKESVYLLMDIINGLKKHENLLVKPHFVMRESTAPPGQGR